MSMVVITIEGVLMAEAGQVPIPNGLLLYGALKDQFNLALITDLDTELVTYWLKLNGLVDHTYVAARRTTDPEDVGARRLRQLARLRERETDIRFVVESDPSAAATLLENGQAVLLHIAPRYSRPEFRPDYSGPKKTWDVLTGEILRQAELRASDKRTFEEVL